MDEVQDQELHRLKRYV